MTSAAKEAFPIAIEVLFVFLVLACLIIVFVKIKDSDLFSLPVFMGMIFWFFSSIFIYFGTQALGFHLALALFIGGGVSAIVGTIFLIMKLLEDY